MPEPLPPIPAGMIQVTRDDFFTRLYADKRDIMPHLDNETFTTWALNGRYPRVVWGWSAPGWKNPGTHAKVYAIMADA